MKMLATTLVLIALAITTTGVAQAKFEAGQISISPEFGFGIDSNFGIVFGGLMTYAITDQMAIGPVFAFSTAGRKFELQDNDETAASKTIVFGGRFYYMFNPEFDYPWYFDAGIAFVKYGSITELDNGKKIGDVYNVDEIEGSMRFGFNFGGGTMYPLNDQMSLVIDANSYIGGHGEPKALSNGQEVAKLTDAGSFWLLTFTVGLNFAL